MGGVRSPAWRYMWVVGVALVAALMSACSAIPWFQGVDAAEPGSGPALDVASPATSAELTLANLILGTWKQPDFEIYNTYAPDGTYVVENREAEADALGAVRYEIVGDQHVRYEMADGTSFVLEVALPDPDTLIVRYPATAYSDAREQHLVRVAVQIPGGENGLRPPADLENMRAIFVDDFSNNENGWPADESEQAVYGPQDDTFMIGVYAENLLYHVDVPRVEAEDVSIEVEATRAGGTDKEMSAAVLCRVSANPVQFYVFEVTFDGYYTIAKYVDGRPVSLGIGYEASRAINAGSATNHIRADCIGDTLSLYVNGTQLAILHDDQLESGRVALGAATFSGKPSAEVRFDNLLISGP